jgi:tetratricopeptide (TPR) repeat protein
MHRMNLLGGLLTIALLLTTMPAAGAERAPLSSQAHRHAEAAFAAIARDDADTARHELQAALQIEPGHPQLLRQWAQVMGRLGRHAEGEAALDRLVDSDPADPLLRLERGYARHAGGRHEPAVEDFEAALSLGLSAGQRRAAILALVDAALAAGRPEAAAAALQPLLANDDFDVHARHALALQAVDRQQQALDAWRRAEQATDDDARKAAAIRTRAQILRSLDRDVDGNAEILDGTVRYPGNRELMLDAAYLAIAAGDDVAAHRRFQHGAEHPEAPAHALVDAAYVANRLGHSTEAASYFRRTIDRFDDADPAARPFDQRQWFGMRRQIQEIERRYGFQAALFYRNSVFIPGTSGEDVLQASVEAFWQPSGVGYRGGRVLQGFVRAIRTLDAPQLERASETLFGAVGVRYKPLATRNLVLTAERVFGIGDLIDDDWLLRAGYSYDHGTDLQPWARSWTTINGFVEAVRFLDAERTVVGAQARFGRSFAVGREEWVVLPHLSLAADYDSAAATQWAGGIGPGIAVRRWFRGDAYWAPASYLDLQLQYRTALGSDKRAEGFAAQLVLYY